MKYGVLLKYKKKPKKLVKAGYIQVPNHCDGMQVDEQWISNTGPPPFNKSQFPRFHYIRVGKECFLHYDYYTDKNATHHKSKIGLCDEIWKEIKRLREI